MTSNEENTKDKITKAEATTITDHEDEEFTVVDVSSSSDTNEVTSSIPSSQHTEEDTIMIQHSKENEDKNNETKEEHVDSSSNRTTTTVTAATTTTTIMNPSPDIDTTLTEISNVWEETTTVPTLTTPTLTVTEATSDPWKDERLHKQHDEDTDYEHVEDDNEKEAADSIEPVIDASVKNSPPILDTETSHRKGFQNANDMDEILDLTISGRLPDWLIGEHYTIGPGIYDVKYLRKVEIDGEIQHASSYFTFGHWFDALPLVNRFDINGARNTISYRNRLPNKRLIEKIRDHHGYTPPHPASVFKTNSNQSVLSKFMKSNVKASKPDAEICGARILPSIPGVVGRLFAQNSAKHIQELDPFDLKPTRIFTWDEINPAFKGYSSCPNGQFDAQTGEYINFTMEVGYQSSQYHFFSISDRDPRGTVIASIAAPTAYINSFSITPKYIIFALFPMIANSGGMKFTWNESILDSFSFAPNESTMFYVISREKKALIAVFRTSSCFAFHHVNAFEDLEQRGNNVHVDMICYSDDTIAHQLSTGSLRHPETMTPSRLASSEVRRYTLVNIEEEHLAFLANQSPLPGVGGNSTGGFSGRFASTVGNLFRNNKNKSIPNAAAAATGGDDGKISSYSWIPLATYELIVQPSLELPHINPHYNMHKYNYMYSLGFSAASSIMDGQVWNSIVKTNVNDKSIVASWHQENCYPSEAIFIPRPLDGSHVQHQEDDGVLVSVVMDSARGMSFLLILDAITLHVLATADLGTLVPVSFAHGTYRLRN
ncbi:retinal pigment epithelial membrane protein-domain-containing protein [Halteromyces radiatus]|uniref:retinal pigment epithelial membrane protein-domain-containing protein n=1 Tax=Halteromyces radiatus TaxID=101107 RepID=UPI0022203205|nr:retinal pigment epithelial membrane protein-domain-containing protein [Halteromyces radiatus]KAI8085086.1 retinal pigment epithelial membrane protein-domain-containing protein [Halteromyces radiatus]